MKIYLAGLEQSDGFPTLEKKVVSNGFLSYYYLRKNTPLTNETESIKRMMFFRTSMKNIILDSGAHTFFSHSDEIKSATTIKSTEKIKAVPEEYFQGYKKWLLAYAEYIDYFVELDIGEIVGQETILRWRRELKAEGLYHKCITVFHPSVMNEKDFDDMLVDSESKYVALEGFRQGQQNFSYLPLIKKCYVKDINS